MGYGRLVQQRHQPSDLLAYRAASVLIGRIEHVLDPLPNDLFHHYLPVLQVDVIDDGGRDPVPPGVLEQARLVLGAGHPYGGVQFRKPIALGHPAFYDDLPAHPNIAPYLGLRPAPDDFHGRENQCSK